MNQVKLLAILDDLLGEIEMEGTDDAIGIFLGGPMLGIFSDAAKVGMEHTTPSPLAYRMIQVNPYNFNGYAIIISTRKKP